MAIFLGDARFLIPGKMVTVSHREASSEREAETRGTHKVKNMDVAVKLNLNQPMTRDLITLVIDKEMKIEDQAEMRDLAFNYMTLMVEQGYVFSKDPAKRYTIREMLDLTYAYLDNFNDAVKRWKLSTKTYC
jgi:hypothetical protein